MKTLNLKNSKKRIPNPGNNILELHISVKVSFATSKLGLAIYYVKLCFKNCLKSCRMTYEIRKYQKKKKIL